MHTVDVTTNYPFSDTLYYKIDADTEFDFFIRIPEWTVRENAFVKINHGRKEALRPNNEGLHRLGVKKGTVEVTVHLPMEITTVSRNETIGVYRGPILYSADIEYTETSHQPLNWTDLQPLDGTEVDPRAKDHILEPTSAWKYALDPETLRVGDMFADGDDLPNPIFLRKNAPVSLQVDAYPIDWPIELDTAALPPIAPLVDRSEKVNLRLIPFAAAKLHIAQFPVARFN